MTFLADPAKYPFNEDDLFLGLAESGEVGISLERHAITVAGSRSGKGACCIIPNLMRWPHNVLCIDPKGENAEITWEHREKLGQSVYVLDPFKSADVPDHVRASFNPLGSIDLSSNRARAAISAIANGLIVVHDPKHMEWTSGARALVAGIIAHVLSEAPPEHHNFATVRSILMRPNEVPDSTDGLYEQAQMMVENTAVGGLIRSAGLTIMTAIESEKSMEKDFLGLARRSTEWLDDDAIADCLNHTTFDLSELKTGTASVYLVLPADGDFLATYGAFLRLFVKASLTAMGANQNGEKCLFILDEFFSLGKLEELSEAAGRMPSYGVHLWPFVQHLGQLTNLYSDNLWQTFFANADAAMFFGNDDTQTTEYVSKRIGNISPQELNIEPPEPAKQMTGETGYNSEMQADFAEKMNDYNQRTREIGRPRLPSEMISSIVGKGSNDKVARSMIVFAHGGDVLHLRPTPYFDYTHKSKMPTITKEQPPLKHTGRAERAEIKHKRQMKEIALKGIFVPSSEPSFYGRPSPFTEENRLKAIEIIGGDDVLLKQFSQKLSLCEEHEKKYPKKSPDRSNATPRTPEEEQELKELEQKIGLVLFAGLVLAAIYQWVFL